MTRISFTLLAAFLCALLPTGVAAQDQDDEGEENQPALPDIAPREVEIRGELEIALPSLERQPLVGFERPPAVPALPEGYVPYVGPYEQIRRVEGADLPGRAEQDRLMAFPAPAQGEVEAGVGRYFSRLGKARVTLPTDDERSAFSLRLDYRGAEGHEPFATEDIRTPYDAFDARLGYETEREAFTLGLALDGFLDRYTLYGAVPVDESDRTLNPQPDRNGRGGGGTLTLSTTSETLPAEIRVRYSEARYETDLFADAASPVRLERRLDASGRVSATVAERDVAVDAALSLAGLDGNAPGNDVTAFDGGARLGVYQTPEVSVTAGARLLTYSTSEISRPDRRNPPSGVYVSPEVRAEWQAAPNAVVFARQTPGVDAQGLADLFAENPFLISEPAVQPTVRLVDAAGGVRLFADARATLSAEAGFQYMPSFLFFEEASPGEDAPFEGGLSAARYDAARVFHAGADAAFRHEASGFNASVGATLRQGRLTDDDDTIPYFAPFVGRAMLSYAFLDERGLVQLTGAVESARFIDREKSEEVGAFFDLDAYAAYDVTPLLGVTLRLDNIAGADALERWHRYPRAPLLITTGLRVRF